MLKKKKINQVKLHFVQLTFRIENTSATKENIFDICNHLQNYLMNQLYLEEFILK